jgi:hypothetical protein
MPKLTKIIAFAIFVVILLVVARQFAGDPVVGDNNRRPLVASAIVADEEMYDFGNISMKAGDVERTYTITNTATTSVTMTKVYTSCMCTEATLLLPTGAVGPIGMPGHGSLPAVNYAMAPGESIDVRVVFDPAAHGPAGLGPTNRVVIVEDNQGGVLQFGLQAMVTP